MPLLDSLHRSVCIWRTSAASYVANTCTHQGLYNCAYDHTCKSMWRFDNVGGLGEYVTCHVLVSYILLYSSARANLAPMDRSWCSHNEDMPSGGRVDTTLHFGSQMSKKHVGDVNRHFQA